MGTIDQREFLKRLATEFPEIEAEVIGRGLGQLHLQVAAFREATERAMDAGQFWAVEKHFCFVDLVRSDASPEVENALCVSYIEDLALGDWAPQRYRAIKERMSSSMHAEIAVIHTNWR